MWLVTAVSEGPAASLFKGILRKQFSRSTTTHNAACYNQEDRSLKLQTYQQVARHSCLYLVMLPEGSEGISLPYLLIFIRPLVTNQRHAPRLTSNVNTSALHLSRSCSVFQEMPSIVLLPPHIKDSHILLPRFVTLSMQKHTPASSHLQAHALGTF